MKPEQLDRTLPEAQFVGYVLDQLRDVVVSLDTDQYKCSQVTTFGGSIGGHVRHCLDHIAALITGADTGVIDYDHRERGTDIETNPVAAMAEVDRLASLLADLPSDITDREVQVHVMLSTDGSVTRLGSTIGRELAFVLSHTIHHGAMIAGMVRALGGDVPTGFGLAPSTIAYRNS